MPQSAYISPILSLLHKCQTHQFPRPYCGPTAVKDTQASKWDQPASQHQNSWPLGYKPETKTETSVAHLQESVWQRNHNNLDPGWL